VVTYRCSECGKRHHEMPMGYRVELEGLENYDRRSVRFERGGELIAAADDRFILANIEFPIAGAPGEQFVWTCWISLSSARRQTKIERSCFPCSPSARIRKPTSTTPARVSLHKSPRSKRLRRPLRNPPRGPGRRLRRYSRSDILVAGVREDLIWLGSTRRDLVEAPAAVRKTMGGAIRTAQRGGKSDLASPMKGDLRDVMEVRD
jgi:hypothetical protein